MGMAGAMGTLDTGGKDWGKVYVMAWWAWAKDRRHVYLGVGLGLG